MSTPVPSPSENSATAKGPARPFGSRLVAPAAVLACLAGGVGASVYLTPRPTMTVELIADSKVTIPKPPPVEPPKNAPEEAVRSRQFDKALALLKVGSDDDKHGRNAFLRGLALEGAGKHADAFDAYRQAADPNRDVAVWAAAGLGACRAALARGDTAAAREWLARVELRTGHPACQATHVAEECRMLRARLDAARLPPVPNPDPLDASVPAVAAFDLNGPYLDWLTEGWPRTPDETVTPDAPPAPPVPLPTGLRVTVENGIPRVSGQLPDTRVTDVFRELARAGGWKLRLPADLNASPSGTSVAVAVNAVPVSEALVSLTEPFGLRARVDGDTLTVETVETADPATAPDPLPIAVGSLTRAAALNDHPHARAAAVRLATLYERLGRTAEAVHHYNRILTDTPHLPEAVHAGYNLSLLHLRGGNPAAARATLREVIDRGGKGRWADLGWWWTGRAFLDECEPATAFKPLRAALDGKDRTTRSAAALGLTLCHLLQGNEAAAHETLERYVFSSDDAHANLAKLFGDYLRHAGSPTAIRAESLYAAVKQADGGRRLGPAGMYLVGRIYRDLGFGAKTVALYEQGITTGGPWTPRLTLAVGEMLADEDRLAEARQRLLAVAAIDPGGLGRQAEMLLADVDLRNGSPAAALARCRRLMDRPDADETALLVLMGRAHEAAGDYRRAALCFGGRRPAE